MVVYQQAAVTSPGDDHGPRPALTEILCLPQRIRQAGDHRRFVVVGKEDVGLGENSGQGLAIARSAERDYVNNGRRAAPGRRSRSTNASVSRPGIIK